MFRKGLLLTLALLLSACQVQWVSKYDAKTDEAISNLQKRSTAFFENLQGQVKPACLYPNHRGGYDELFTDAKTLLFRAEVIDAGNGLNRRTIKQANKMINSLEALQTAHKATTQNDVACLSAGFVADTVESFDASFRAMLTFELAKKREFQRGTKEKGSSEESENLDAN